jgi:hypothetical protein
MYQNETSTLAHPVLDSSPSLPKSALRQKHTTELLFPFLLSSMIMNFVKSLRWTVIMFLSPDKHKRDEEGRKVNRAAHKTTGEKEQVFVISSGVNGSESDYALLAFS